MLKQKKNLNIKNKFSSNFQKRSSKQNKNIYRLRKIFKKKSYFINPTFQEISNNQNTYLFSKKIDIRVTPNNVFCTLKNCFNNKTIKIGSAGKYKIKTSKKTLKYSCKIIVGFFLKEIKQDINSKKILVNLTGPISLRWVRIPFFPKILYITIYVHYFCTYQDLNYNSTFINSCCLFYFGRTKNSRSYSKT